MNTTPLYKTIKPLPHQQRLLDQNPKKAILNWEMRVGKTLPASIWVDNPCRSANAYIITPKGNIKDWQNMGTEAHVMTKEEFKKIAGSIVKPTAIVVDEGHYFASPLFIRRGKGRSELATSLYKLVRDNPDMDILILTATPIRQDAWSLHTLLCYIGVYYDWKWWREKFFSLEKAHFIKKVPGKWTPDEIWVPSATWKTDIRPFVEKHTDIVSLKDIVEYLPPATTTLIKVKHDKYEKPTDEVVTWVHEHQYEQRGKGEEILKLGYKKVIVVVQYTYQIDSLAQELGKDKPVFILDGRTKDPDATKRAAQEAEECYFIVQAGMGFGFDGYMFGAMVFASMSHSHVHHTQMSGRPRHPKHLTPVNYYYLIGGRWDKRIYDTIREGRDFNPHIYLNE